jgi:solute carrier family 12 (sodium/potassium/chloride transporter), member 2
MNDPGRESAQEGNQANGGDGAGAQARFGAFGGVFTPCVLTILGVIMFMRTGFVTGYAGLWLGLAILAISKVITTLTAFSLSAVATNLRMRVGGVYFMISRVLGPDFGGSIGITLFIAQAVSVAFYTIGFTEALMDVLRPLLVQVSIGEVTALDVVAAYKVPQILSSVVIVGLFGLTLKGADIALKAQLGVLVVLLLSVASFIIGGAIRFDPTVYQANLAPSFGDGIGFWTAFAIFFPAATGITAGANLSGDLKNPAKAIPVGTLLAILFTATIYIAQMVLTAGSADREVFKQAPFAALQQMSLFGPLVVLGVFAATLSSALGSFLGAPRILQAMGQDRLMRVFSFFGKGAGATQEPRRATILTLAIAVGVIWAGDLNAVAEIISMFFLIAYGMINLSAFIESRSANPSFRPQFRYFHWSLALAGAIGCAVVMIKINETYALVAFGIVALLYFYLRKQDIQTSWGDAKRGYIFQRTKDNLMYLEGAKTHPKNWRPLMLAITEDPMVDRQLIWAGSWLESRRGLYMVAQIAERGPEDLDSRLKFRKAATIALKKQLKAEGIQGFSQVTAVDEFTRGLSTFLQSYSIGGLQPNTALVAMPPPGEEDRRERFLRMTDVIASFDLNLVVLKPGDLAPNRPRRTIDLWWRGYQNGSLMSLFAYLMTLDNAWSDATIRILRIVRDDREAQQAADELSTLRDSARIPARIRIIRSTDPPLEVIASESGTKADLVLLGLMAATGEDVRKHLAAVDGLLRRLPTTVLVASNGEADMFV